MSVWLEGDNSTFHSTPATKVVDISGNFGCKFSLLLRGGMGGCTMAVEGGDGTTFAPVMVTSPASGSTHTALTMTATGLYTFSACCTHLRLSLSGGAAPTIAYAVLTEARP